MGVPLPFEDARTMNHDHELECAVLGDLIHEEDGEALLRLMREDFTLGEHRALFEALRSMAEHSEPWGDWLLVNEYVKLHGIVGIANDCFARLAEVVHAGRHNLRARCRVLRELQSRRLVAEFRTRGPWDEGPERLAAMSAELYARIEMIAWGSATELDFLATALEPPRMLPTRLLDLDTVCGGIGPKDFVVLGARPSVGKSALALSCALKIADQGFRVRYLSLEQSAAAQIWRAIAHLERVNGTVIRREPGAWKETILRGYETLTRLPLKIVDQQDWSIGAIMREAQEPCDLLIVDYLQQITCDARTEYERVTQAASALKDITRRRGVPVLACAQIGRAAARDKRPPTMADLKSSGQIEQDADQVWLLHREADKNGRPSGNVAKLIVDKNRDGDTGSMVLAMFPDQYRFENAAHGGYQGPSNADLIAGHGWGDD